MLPFNQDKTLHYLQELVNIPSPSGFTHMIMSWIESQCQLLKVTYKITNKGGLIITLPGQDNTMARLLTAHTDTLGAMVKSIKADGRLKLTMIGGFNWNAVEGEYCQVHTASGKIITGTIMMHQTSVHVYRGAGDFPRNDENMEVRLDEKTFSQEDTEKLGISVGDFISFSPRYEITSAGFVKSRHLDDKACVALLISLLESIQSNQLDLPHTTYFYISNNEEIGFGGNSSIPESVVEYLAVDMGAIGDGQTSDEYSVSICAKDSSGPYHYRFTRALIDLAKEHNINYQVDIYPYYGSDASTAIRAGHDIRHALIGPGIESSHALERTHVDSLQATFQLLYYYITTKMID